MRALVQRALDGSVEVEGQKIAGFTGQGLVVLLGVTHDDTEADARWISSRLAKLEILESERILREETGRETSPASLAAQRAAEVTESEKPLSARQAGAPVLLVSQFTLYGSVRKGRKPSWTHAAPGEIAEPLYELTARLLREEGLKVSLGRFGALMQVKLTNYGPYTLWLDSRAK